MSLFAPALHPFPVLSFAEKTLPRLVVGMDGCIATASEGFEQLVHAVPYSLEQSYLKDIMTFTDPDDALRGGPVGVQMGTAGAALWARAIRDGIYPVYLRGRGKEIFYFQFNWIQGVAGARYLVLSLNEEGVSVGVRVDEPDIYLASDDIDDFQIDDQASTTERDSGVPLRSVFDRTNPQMVGVPSADTVFGSLSDDIMMVLDAEGGIKSVNDAFYKGLGYRPSQLPVLNFVDIISPTDRALARSLFLDMVHIQSGQMTQLDLSLIGEDRDARQMLCRMKWDGDVAYVLAHDVSVQKRQEEAFRRQKQQLAEAESIAQMGYWRWAVGAETLEISDEIFRIFGKEPKSFTPTLDVMRGEMNRADRARMAQIFQRAMIERNSYEMDFTLRLAGDNLRYIRCEGRCEQDEKGDVTALYGIMQDMTEQTQVERDLLAAKNAAERAYESKSKFLANMSHELRTPLNAIIGFSEMMQRQLLGPIGTPRYLEYIGGIRESGEHLLDLISDILDMSKIEAGKFKLEPEEINIAKLSRLAVGMIEGRAREAGIRLVYDSHMPEVCVIADRRAVLQIMLNLLSNAIKFTPKEGTIAITLGQQDHRVLYRVADTGIGIPEDKLAVITSPFEQVANEYTRAHDGSGLGLAITKELCLMHNGHMDIQSTEGVGTSVTVTLPIGQDIQS